MSRFLRPFASATSLLLALGCGDVDIAAPITRTGSRAQLDLDPSAPGYYIPGVNPEACFRGTNATVVDHDEDLDWMNDWCEFELATAFAPIMRLHQNNDNCPGWEPYWAAKIFSDGQRVRIAYMPAYYQDCGEFGHAGDSEFVIAQLIFDSASNRWILEALFTSAHYHAEFLGLGFDRSAWTPWNWVQSTDRPRGRPLVWVAPQKHANYSSLGACINGEVVQPGASSTDCDASYNYDRPFPVHAARNVGSRFRDLVGCVTSSGMNSASGRCERFYDYYTVQKFNGWFPAAVGTGGSTAYHNILLSDKFELYGPGGDWGLGPADVPSQQPPPGFYVNIMGTSEIGPYVGCGWFASVATADGGTPTNYAWKVNGQSMGSNTDTFYYDNTGAAFQLEVAVTTTTGAVATGFLNVSVVTGVGCS